MRKKQKIDKRLNQLFRDIKSEEAPAKRRRTKVTEEPQAPHPEPAAAKEKEPKTGPLSIEPIAKSRPIKRQTASLPQLDVAQAESPSQIGSRMALTFQAGQKEWATLQVLDETAPRAWSQDEQLLVKQVTDQLSLALENAQLFQETRKRAEETAVLNELGRSLASQLTLDQVVAEVYNGITRLLNAKNFYIAFYDREKNEIIFPQNISESAIDRSITRLPIGEGLTSHVIKTGESVFIMDGTDKWLAERGLKPAGDPARSYMAVPLFQGEEVIGAIALQEYTSYNAYTEHDLELLQAFANQASIAIQNAKLFKEARDRAEELSALNRIVTSASQTLELQQILDQLLHQVLEIIGFSTGLITMVDEKTDKLFLVSHENLPSSMVNLFKTKGFEGTLCDYVYKTNSSVGLDDVRDGSPVNASGLINNGLLSYLGVPLEAKGHILGTLCTFHHTPGLISSRVIDLTRSAGIQIGFAIENARLFRETMDTEERLQLIVETVPVPILITSMGDGKVLFANPQLGQTLGLDPKALIGGPTPDIYLNPEERDALTEKLMREGVVRDHELALKAADGSPLWLLLNLQPITYSGQQALLIAFYDVTARKQAEEKLAQERHLMQSLMDSIPDQIYFKDRDSRFIRVNKGVAKVFDQSDPEQIVGKTDFDFFTEDHARPAFEDEQTIIRTGQPIMNKEERETRQNEPDRWVSTIKMPLRDQDGNTIGTLGVSRDITALKRVEEDLRSSETRLLQALQVAKLAYWQYDFVKDEFTFNDQFYALFHTTAEHEGGYTMPAARYAERFVYPDDMAVVGAEIQKAVETTDPNYTVELDHRILYADGGVGHITVRFSIEKDAQGRTIRSSGANQDITERKIDEQALQRRNTYLSVSAEIGRVITSTLDLNTIFSRTVNLISERFGFYHAAIFIVEETGFNAVVREGTGEAGARMKSDKHTLAVDSESIVGQVTARGTPFVVNNTTLEPLHRPNPLLPETQAEAAIPLRVGNRVIGALDIQSTSVDAFTEDDVAVLQTLADQVAIAIDNARSYELSQQAVMEMREIDRLKSQFLANMSHELRTPLNSIIGFSRVILKGIDGPVTELQQQDLTAIYNSGQHLLGLINDVLDLSKIEAGKMELAFDEVNIADVTNSVLSTMTGVIKDKSITLRRNIQQDLPTVRADAIRVRQVMINLLSNAAKFTEEGEIVVDVGVRHGPGDRPEMIVSVTDTGPGITPQDQAKLFQPFSQVDDSPTRKTGGTGLGLSICQHLIQMHGGRIGVHSEIGKGSTFYFTLPLYRKELESERTGGPGRVILAIDDDPQVIGLYERYLQPQGYQVISLTDPSRALERVRQLKPFAVTLDIMMPGIDGWQVLGTLKSDPETRDIPVIICSIIEDQDKGFSLGAADYLVKPILEEDLVSALDRLNADGSIREVLIVDDDPNDLRLIGRMLTDDGRYKPILAQGGMKGWQIITSPNPPQAVILDLFMPDLDGFRILESMRADVKLRDLPVIVITGVELTAEQKKQLDDFGQRLLTKGSFNEKELFTLIQRSLKRVPA